MTQQYQFAGIQSDVSDPYFAINELGGIFTEYTIFACAIYPESDDQGPPFPIGKITTRAIDKSVLSYTKNSLINAIDIDADGYSWAQSICFDTDNPKRCPLAKKWVKALGEDAIYASRYVGIESAYINPLFRGHSIFKHALIGIASRLGVLSETCFVLLACSLEAQTTPGDATQSPPAELNERLAAFYETCGFTRVSKDAGRWLMALPLCYANPAFERLWDAEIDLFEIDESLLLDSLKVANA